MHLQWTLTADDYALVLWDGGAHAVLCRTPRPAVLFDAPTGHFLKTGSERAMLQLAANLVERQTRQAPGPGRGITPAILSSPNFPLSELNRCLTVTGYVGRLCPWIERHAPAWP